VAQEPGVEVLSRERALNLFAAAEPPG
jgi:hypothetical protein